MAYIDSTITGTSSTGARFQVGSGFPSRGGGQPSSTSGGRPSGSNPAPGSANSDGSVSSDISNSFYDSAADGSFCPPPVIPPFRTDDDYGCCMTVTASPTDWPNSFSYTSSINHMNDAVTTKADCEARSNFKFLCMEGSTNLPARQGVNGSYESYLGVEPGVAVPVFDAVCSTWSPTPCGNRIVGSCQAHSRTNLGEDLSITTSCTTQANCPTTGSITSNSPGTVYRTWIGGSCLGSCSGVGDRALPVGYSISTPDSCAGAGGTWSFSDAESDQISSTFVMPTYLNNTYTI